MDKRVREIENQLNKAFGSKVSLTWEEDSKGAIWGNCRLPNSEMIYQIALLVSHFKGRVITITPYLHGEEESNKVLSIAYHFDIQGITMTCTISLRDCLREVKSITPVLKSADWNEREMQETYHIRVLGHPNPKRLFLDESINLTDNTMVPLSVAMSGASSQTLWEKVLSASKEGVRENE